MGLPPARSASGPVRSNRRSRQHTRRALKENNLSAHGDQLFRACIRPPPLPRLFELMGSDVGEFPTYFKLAIAQQCTKSI
jgi:hypothetical protein